MINRVTNKQDLHKVTSGNVKTLSNCHCACVSIYDVCRCIMYVCASEKTVKFIGHCNPLRLSLSAFLYLYSKCQCINAFQRGNIATQKRRARGERSRDKRVLCALGEPCKQHGGGRGIYREK